MTYRFFSHDLSNFDALEGTVTGKNANRLFIRASVPHDPDVFIYGFSFWETAQMVPIGAKAIVSIVKEFNDGEFRFHTDAISETSTLVPVRGKRGKENPVKTATVA